MTSNLKFLLAFGLVAMMFSFDTGTGFGPEAAWAQASDLRCRQCVNRRDIRRGAVKFNRLQPKVRNRITGLESAAQERVPFYVTLDGDNAQQTIVTNGTLTLFARCRVNDAGQDRVEIVATNSAAGWFAENDPVTGDTGPFAAFEEVVILSHESLIGDPRYDDDNNEGSAAAPDGSFIGIVGEGTGLGTNMFGHDCVAIGNAFPLSGTL